MYHDYTELMKSLERDVATIMMSADKRLAELHTQSLILDDTLGFRDKLELEYKNQAHYLINKANSKKHVEIGISNLFWSATKKIIIRDFPLLTAHMHTALLMLTFEHVTDTTDTYQVIQEFTYRARLLSNSIKRQS